MTENMPVAEQKKAMLGLLTSNMKAVKSVLPKHISPERIMRVAFQAISRNPKLMECTQASIINSLLEASQLGLEIGGPLSKASLVPFWNKNIGKREAQLIIGFRGMIELAYRSPKVKNFQAHPVFSNDSFEYAYGTSPYLEHRPFDGDDRGELVNGYAIVFYDNGGIDFEVVDRFIAMKHKAKSRSDLWNDRDAEPEMWVKTAIRRLSKRIPQSEELQRAASLDEAADYGRAQEMANVIDMDIIDGIAAQTDSNGHVRSKLAEQKGKALSQPPAASDTGQEDYAEDNPDEPTPEKQLEASRDEYEALCGELGKEPYEHFRKWGQERLDAEIKKLLEQKQPNHAKKPTHEELGAIYQECGRIGIDPEQACEDRWGVGVLDINLNQAQNWFDELKNQPSAGSAPDGLFEKPWEPSQDLLDALNNIGVSDISKCVKRIRAHYGDKGLEMQEQVEPNIKAALSNEESFKRFQNTVLGIPV
jgi:recombination protein RecT